MKSCGTCVHGVERINELIQCMYPVPLWIKRELCGPLLGGVMADRLYAWTQDCPTYQPREEAS